MDGWKRIAPITYFNCHVSPLILGDVLGSWIWCLDCDWVLCPRIWSMVYMGASLAWVLGSIIGVISGELDITQMILSSLRFVSRATNVLLSREPVWDCPWPPRMRLMRAREPPASPPIRDQRRGSANQRTAGDRGPGDNEVRDWWYRGTFWYNIITITIIHTSPSTFCLLTLSSRGFVVRVKAS